MNESVITRLLFATFVLLLIAALSVAVYWDKEPAAFNVMDNTIATADQLKQPMVAGTATTATLMTLMNSLFEKRGGYLANDVMPPGLFMDNMPQWEYGVVLQVRDLTRALRDRIGRGPAAEDEDLALAETRFSIDNASWIMPDAEDEYQEGIVYLQHYLQRLSDSRNRETQFYATAGNLDYWLGLVDIRIARLSERLSASVGQKRLYAEDGDTDTHEEYVKTPWLEIDDVFYEARGTSWALIHLLKAIEIDFADVLKDKNAKVAVARIIRELEATQQEPGSPIVLNGSGFGLLANYSLVMASYLSRANAAVTELRTLLEKPQATSE